VKFLSLFVAVWLIPCLVLPSDSLLDILYDDEGWILIDSTETGQRIYSKVIGGFNLPAIMVKQMSSVSPSSLVLAIEDVDHYCDFLRGVYLERTAMLAQTELYIDEYQLIDLPLVSNRHYLLRLVKPVDSSKKNIRLDWTALPRNSLYTTFLDSMEKRYQRPIYVDKNVGGWEIIVKPQGRIEVTFRNLSDPAGLIPDFLITKLNRFTAPKIVQGMIQEAIRRESD